jgi:hypothetical protein
MKINQLYRSVPSPEIVEALLAAIDVDGTHTFDRNTMERGHACEKIMDLYPALRDHYIPCKARLYLSDPLTVRGAISIMRQVFRVHGITLLSREKNNGNKKIIVYRAVMPGEKHGMCMQARDVLIEF